MKPKQNVRIACWRQFGHDNYFTELHTSNALSAKAKLVGATCGFASATNALQLLLTSKLSFLLSECKYLKIAITSTNEVDILYFSDFIQFNVNILATGAMGFISQMPIRHLQTASIFV